MKKQILAILAAATVLTPVAVQAKTSPHELRQDVREIRQDKQALNQAKKYGTQKQVSNARKDIRNSKQEYRQDKRDYRQATRANYRADRFNAPFRYRTLNVGVRLAPQYYGSRYIVSNYASQRLPGLHGNQRYVRHYNDLLLVNTRTGNVLKVYRGFYW